MTGLEHYKKREWLSISSLISFSRCPRKYFYGSGCRLGSPSGPHPALTFGQAIHKALPQLLIGEDSTKLDRALEAFDSIWTKEVEESTQDEKRNKNGATQILMDFFFAHSQGRSIYELVKPPESNVIKAEDVSDYEVPFAIDIGLSVPLVGRIDALVRHRDSHKLWALEWKTASEVSARFLEGFQRSLQCLCYTLALRILTNEPIEGTLVEALLVAAPAKRTGSQRTLTQIVPIIALPHHIEAFISWARYYGSLLLECERIGDFPQDFKGCHPYAQFASIGYPCEFSNLCDVPDWTKLKDFYAITQDRPFVLSSSVQNNSNKANSLKLPQLSPNSIEPTV